MRYWVAALLVVACRAQPQASPETLLLEKIKARVAENLSRLPNFTCTETIRRSELLKSTSTPQMMDTVRLEVAFVGRKELYGWPGAARIDEPDVGKLAGGSVGNGYFALFLNNIFLVSSTTFRYDGRVQLDGREMLRYDYRVPQSAGAYRLRSARGAAVVGYHGSFWVAEGSADPVRIKVIFDKVPTELGFSAARSLLDYGTVKIGAATALVPQAAETVFTDTRGNEHRNQLSFESCHEFVGETVVKFNVAPGTGVALPDDFAVDAELETPIDSDTAAGGDAIRAILRDDIQMKDNIVVPKGAALSGRIARITRNGAAYTLDFAFTSLDYEGGHADLSQRENNVEVRDWAKIRQSPKLNLARGALFTLHSSLRKSGK